jgi:6,7-dimethyl-8-ribityllumazine synthase
MAEDKNLFANRELPWAKGLHFAVVTARFNSDITEKLTEGAKAGFAECRAESSDIDFFEVPGCFELPLVAKRLAETGRYAGIVCLGAVIKGGTPHFDYVCAETAAGINRAALDTGIPIAFGVLTTNTHEQAEERAGGALGNKGRDAALTVVETAATLRSAGA